MKRICTICARGGSKGVPNKNIRPLLGKPLIAYSIEQARDSRLFACIGVSSDSPEILRIAQDFGADHVIERPAALATDQSAKLPAIQHCVLEIEARSSTTFDTMVDLDATAPLRLPEDIAGAVARQEAGGCANVITGCLAHRSPYFNLVEDDGHGFVRLCKPPTSAVDRRQDAPRCFDVNASIYVWSRETFFTAEAVLTDRTALYEMPAARSHDIDSELDFEIVSFLMQQLEAA